MEGYEEKAKEELHRWKIRMEKRPSMVKRASKNVQNKINHHIPDRAHQLITETIKKMVEAILTGTEYTNKPLYPPLQTLEEKEAMIRKRLSQYKKTAAAEGAGTGLGGVFLGLADFPMLLTIKLKFLFETASIHGFDTKRYDERLFLLHIFQLAFSSEQHRKTTLGNLQNWEQFKEKAKKLDWRQFQQEYRDYIDFAKMLQLIPGFGAIVGAVANYNLLDHLGETAINCYRLRVLEEKSGNQA